MNGEMKQNYRKLKAHMYKAIGMMLKLFPCAAGISYRRFYKLLSHVLQTQFNREASVNTVKRYTTRGIPRDLAIDDLFEAIERVYQEYVNNPKAKNPEEANQKILLAKSAHEKVYPALSLMVERFYTVAKRLNEFDSCFNDEAMMKLRAYFVYKKGFLVEGKSSSKEEADLLAESVRRYSYQDFLKWEKQRKCQET